MRLDKILFLSSLLLTAAESGITTANERHHDGQYYVGTVGGVFRACPGVG